MSRTVSRLGFAVTTLVWIGSIAFSGISSADMDIQKQAKAAGIAVDNCAYCHVEKMPKKGSSTMNGRGKWLMDEKAKRKAEKVDGAWLKDYPGDKK